jgi:hypothetical protein
MRRSNHEREWKSTAGDLKLWKKLLIFMQEAGLRRGGLRSGSI